MFRTHLACSPETVPIDRLNLTSEGSGFDAQDSCHRRADGGILREVEHDQRTILCALIFTKFGF